MPGQGVVVKLSGPILSGMAPGIILGILNDAITDVAVDGERMVKGMAEPSPKGVFHTAAYAGAHGYRQSGDYHRDIHGELQSSLHGIIHDSNAIYGPWLEGTGSRNQTTRFKGYAMFRRTTQQLERKAPDILQKRVTKSLRRLG